MCKLAFIILNDDSKSLVVEFIAHYKITKYISTTSGKALCFAVGLERHANRPNKYRATFCWERFRLMLNITPVKTTSERCIGTYSCRHTNRNAYFDHLASVGIVSLSTICPFVSSSIVTFPRECVCVPVCFCVFLRVGVCVITGMHTCLYIQCVFYCQTSIWSGSIAKVRWRSILHS